MRTDTATGVRRRKGFLDKVVHNRADTEVEPWSWARPGQDKKKDDPTDILPPKPPSLYDAAMQQHNRAQYNKQKEDKA